MTLPKEGISISNKMAQKYNIEVGDVIKWRFYNDNKWRDSTITKILKTPIGQGIFINKEALGKDIQFNPNVFVTKETSDELFEYYENIDRWGNV